MELRRYLTVLGRRRALVIVTVIVAMFGAWLITPRQSTYTATATVFVGNNNYLNGDPASRPSGDIAAGVDRIALTFAAMFKSYPIVEDALQRTGITRDLDDTVANTSSAVKIGTQLVTVTVTDKDPTVAQRLADGLADGLVEKVKTYSPTPTVGTVPSLPAYVFAHAQLPTKPAPNGLMQNLLTAFVFGLLASAALIFLLEYLDITLRSAADAEDRLGLPVLGVIPLASSYRPGDDLVPASLPPARADNGRPGATSPVRSVG